MMNHACVARQRCPLLRADFRATIWHVGRIDSSPKEVTCA